MTQPETTAAAATSRHLRQAALESFAARGFHATTTRDIAARVGMSPAAVYIHFNTKEELLFAISRDGHAAALAALREGAVGADPAERLAGAVRDFTLWHAAEHTTARVVQYELNSLSPTHRDVVAELRRQTEVEMRELLHAGVVRGVFAVADVPGTAIAVLSLCIDVARWFRPRGARSAEDVADLYADLALRMVGYRG